MHHTTRGSAMKFILPVFIVIALIAVAGYYITMRGKGEKSLIAHALQTMTDRFGTTSEGKPVFDYADVQMQREDDQWIITLINPSWTVELPKRPQLTFHTPQLVLLPDSLKFESVTARLPQPMMVDRKGEEWLQITFPQPLTAQWQQVKQDELTLYETVVDVPESAEIQRLVKPKQFHFSHAGGEKIRILSGADLKQFADIAIELRMVELEAQPKGETLQAERIQADMNWQNRAPEPSPVRWDIQVDQFHNSVQGSMPYGPVDAKLVGNYQGNIPDRLEDFSWARDVRDIDLSTLSLQAETFGLQAYGSFKRQGNELLPVGQGDIVVDNVPALRNALALYDMQLDAKDTRLADLVLRASTGQRLDEADVVELHISR
ncbi:MAG: hypothetical protein CMM93_00255, partial [Rickettsiales bacterium]|nr:hypothetical protein [Rickettsiales bacterium]